MKYVEYHDIKNSDMHIWLLFAICHSHAYVFYLVTYLKMQLKFVKEVIHIQELKIEPLRDPAHMI